jgi:hypothetical protein
VIDAYRLGKEKDRRNVQDQVKGESWNSTS